MDTQDNNATTHVLSRAPVSMEVFSNQSNIAVVRDENPHHVLVAPQDEGRTNEVKLGESPMREVESEES
ncbi:MAG: hypothetical protein ACOCTM_02420, partial [Bacteroidota bacterium]